MSVKSNSGKVTIFTVIWMLVGIVIGRQMVVVLQPENPLFAIIIFIIGLFLPVIVSTIVFKFLVKDLQSE